MKIQFLILAVLFGIMAILIAFGINWNVEVPKPETINNVMSAREILIIGDIVAETWADSVQVMGRDSSGSLVVHVFMPNSEIEIYGVQ